MRRERLFASGVGAGCGATRRGRIRYVVRYDHMGHTITVRLTPELAAWLKETSARTGVPQGAIIREQLERARGHGDDRAFMKLAGAVSGARDLSAREGFSRP